MLTKAVTFFNHYLEPLTSSIHDGTRYWQEKSLNIILFSTSLLGIPVYLLASYLCYINNYLILFVVFTIVFITVLFFFFNRKIPFNIRATISLHLPYIIGTFILFTNGVRSVSLIWMFLCPLLTSMLISFKSSLIGILVNLLTFTGAGIYFYLTDQNDPSFSSFWVYWGMIALNFIILNFVSSILISVLFKGLQTTIAAKEEAKRKYQRMYEKIADVYFEIDIEGIIQSITPSSEQMLCMKNNHLKGMSLFSLMTEAGAKRFKDEIKQNETVNHMEVHFGSCDNSNLICSVSAQRMQNLNAPDTIVGTLQNISNLKIIEMEKQDLELRLNRAEKMESLGLIAGGIAHDLNNILSGVVGYPDLLLSESAINEQQRTYLLALKESGKRASTVLDELLNITKRSTTLRDIQDINSLTEFFLKTPEFLKLKEQNPKITVDINLNSTHSNIMGSSIQVHKLLMNLIFNAAEAQPQGGRIEITTSNLFNFKGKGLFGEIPHNDYYLLSIRDEGMGIAKENLARVFEPFFTKKPGTKAGTGLGMTLVWGIIEDHKGYIDIKSEEKMGTLIQVYLPLTREEKKNKEIASELLNLHGNGEFVLVVDDLDIQRDLNKYLLKQLNYKTTAVENGEAAVEFLKSNKADLILLDMIMGDGMDGLDTFIEIKKMNPEQKVIILSGYTDRERIEEAFRLGINDFLKKPCPMDSLAISLKKTLMETT